MTTTTTAQSQHQQPLIFRLPNELLLQIQLLLPLVSRACLGLSCKTFLTLSGSVLRDEELRFPRIIFDRDQGLRCDKATTARCELMLRLEDDRWRYCSRCLKLHPAREFHPLELEIPACWRRCNHLAGIVDLCPCLRLTFRDKLRLVEQLKQRDSRPYAFGDRVWHECAMLDPPWAIQVQIAPSIEHGQLVVRTQYAFGPQMDKRPFRCSDMPSIWRCPHDTIFGSCFVECDRCATAVVCDYRSSDLEQYRYVVRVHRTLGAEDGSQPDVRWERQCTPAYTLLNYRNW